MLAFMLALFLMVFPVEADLLDVLLRKGRFVMAGVVATICFVAVFTPLILSWRRRRREPGTWKWGGFLVAAGAILGLNALVVGTVFIYQLFR